jgi:hypothetical protein
MWPSMVQTTMPGSEGLFSHGPVHAAADPVRKGFVHDIGRFPVVSYATEYRAFAAESQPVRAGARPVPFAPNLLGRAAKTGLRVRLQRKAGEMVEIRLRNSMTRRVERLEPIDPENVRMYVCGPTVYDRAHLGNARPVVVFDVLYRLLKHVYGPEHVTYVRNITDVEDKIIDRAAERGIEIDELTRTTTEWFHEDMAALGVDYRDDPQFKEPRATDYIPRWSR